MRKLYLLFFYCFSFVPGYSQDLSIDDLLTLTSLPQQKFDNYIARRGFAKSRTEAGFVHDSIDQKYRAKENSKKKKKNPSAPEPVRWIQKVQDSKFHSLLFLTSSFDECDELKEDLRKEGFECNDTLDSFEKPMFYRKKNVIVQVNAMVENTDTMYSFKFKEKIPPPPVKIHFADDLLQFTSHEHLEDIFGKENVKKDEYFFTPTESKNCTVLFPNTEKRAVFLWKNETTMEDLAAIVFGGSLQVPTEMNYAAHVAPNSWELSNGMHCNMNLRELLVSNEMDFQFYGKRSPYFLSVVPQNTGALDLRGLTVMLGCLNCESSNLLNAETVSAADALRYGLRMYVMMIMVTPDGWQKVSR